MKVPYIPRKSEGPTSLKLAIASMTQSQARTFSESSKSSMGNPILQNLQNPEQETEIRINKNDLQGI